MKEQDLKELGDAILKGTRAEATACRDEIASAGHQERQRHQDLAVTERADEIE